MYHLVLLLVGLWVSITAAGLNDIIKAFTNPIEKTVLHFGFSQCENVKKLLGVDYDTYKNSELDMSDLTLNFRTRAVNMSYRLTAAAAVIARSQWFNPQQPLKIYLHGFTNDPYISFTTLSDAFLSRGDFNMLGLDAKSLIHSKYLRATTMVRFIGDELGKILAALAYAGLPPTSIHLIGYSLGSHISSFAGKTFLALTGQRVGRISGLDPAGPCFSDMDINLRLSLNDAMFVDVIHTNAGIYGMEERIGHVDFYPNGGSRQPSCMPPTSCSHSRAWELFAESVMNPQAFIATNCASWDDFTNGLCNQNDVRIMGYGCRPGTVGLYYLRTAQQSPYGLGFEGARYTDNGGFLSFLSNKLGMMKPQFNVQY